MKCCESPTTSTAPNGTSGISTAAQAKAAQTRELAAQFEALLIKGMFAPVAHALGFYGDLVVGEVATTVARNGHGGLTDRLTDLIDAQGGVR